MYSTIDVVVLTEQGSNNHGPTLWLGACIVLGSWAFKTRFCENGKVSADFFCGSSFDVERWEMKAA